MKQVRTMTGLLVLMMILVVSFAGCKEEPGRSSLRLTMQRNDDQNRSILPEDTPLEVSRYAVTGTGPQGSTFEMQSANPTMEVEGLLMGNWEITAVGQNRNGVNLVSGSTTCSLTSEPTNALIELNTLMGTGTMNVQFTWDKTKISNPSIDLWVTDPDGIKTKVNPTTSNYINGSVYYSETYPSCSYMLQGRLYSGTTSVAGCAEVVRIVGGKTTDGTIALDLDKYPEIPSSLTLVNKVGTPIECSISGITTSVTAFQAVTASVTVPESENNEGLGVLWFLDGEQISSSLECTFTPSTGKHRLDLIAKGALQASSGSASISFKAIVAGNPGHPVLANTVTDNTDGLKISGNTKIAFLPDGKILLASSIHSTLQICRIVRDSLEVIRTYTQADGFNTAVITDMLVDKNTNKVAIADNQGPRVTLYQYNSANASLTKLFSRDNVAYKYGSTQTTFASISSLMLDPSTGILYNVVPGTNMLPKSNLFATQASEFNMYSYNFWLGDPIKISGLVISPFLNRAAWYSTEQSIIKISKRSAEGNLFSFVRDFSATNTPYFNGISAAEFTSENDLMTGGSDTLNRFHFSLSLPDTGKEGWEQVETWQSGLDGIGEMQGIVQLFTNSSRGLLYALCKGSRNIKVFSIDPITNALAYEQTVSLASFSPSKAAISPNKENMLVVSDTNDQVLIFSIPQ
ncbi:MAG: hypothetical protein EOM68_00400 [Spirochaetia bacterium]|nr:hypothetical protein [Spirochaetia bacterium]